MGRIEEQVTKRTNGFIADLSWYVHSMNLIQADYFRAVNDLNIAFNERMNEYREAPKKKRTRKSANTNTKSKEN